MKSVKYRFINLNPGKKVKCPKCDKEMEEGFVVSFYPMYWNKEHVVSFHDGVLLSENQFGGASLKGYRCAKCRQVTCRSL